MTSLNLNATGRKLLKVLRRHASRLAFTGDVLLYVESCGFSQSMVDRFDSDDLHQIIRLTAQQSRFDRWQAARRDTAKHFSDLCDAAIEDMDLAMYNHNLAVNGDKYGEDSGDLTCDQCRLLGKARFMLGDECCRLLESGYSVRETERALGLGNATIAKKLRSLREAD